MRNEKCSRNSVAISKKMRQTSEQFRANLCRRKGGRCWVARKGGFRGGELEWWKRGGRGGIDSLHPKDLAQLTDGNIILHADRQPAQVWKEKGRTKKREESRTRCSEAVWGRKSEKVQQRAGGCLPRTAEPELQRAKGSGGQPGMRSKTGEKHFHTSYRHRRAWGIPASVAKT